MARPKTPSDRHLLIDCWRKSRPLPDEHRLAITINFTDYESNRLKKSGGKYLTQALKTVRGLLKDFNPVDVVIVVERNKTLSAGGIGLHVHGWIRVNKSISAQQLQDKLNQKASSNGKVANSRGVVVRDMNWRTQQPIDIGWVAYIIKDFDRTPSGCVQSHRKFSVSADLRTSAKNLRDRQSRKLRNLTYVLNDKRLDTCRQQRKYRHMNLARDEYEYNEYNEYDAQ